MNKRLKIILFTRYDQLGASSRLRFLQFLPVLEQEFTIKICPLFCSNYLRQYYTQGTNSKFYILKRYIQRITQLGSIANYDVVWIEKELFPYLPQGAESLLSFIGKPYIVDYDDAIFHNYDLGKNPIKKILAKKIDKVMANASLVSVGSDYLADRALKANATKVVKIPTVIDINRYTMLKKNKTTKSFVIGWIGSPTTAKYLNLVIPVIRQLATRYDISLRIIGAKIENTDVTGVNSVYVPWRETSEVAEIQKFDIGIMPLIDSPWERGKCGYKLIQYMACGIPVIASPIGINNDMVTNARSGFLANTPEDWHSCFEELLANAELRHTFGLNGRKAVEDSYSVQVVAPTLTQLLNQIGGNECAV